MKKTCGVVPKKMYKDPTFSSTSFLFRSHDLLKCVAYGLNWFVAVKALWAWPTSIL